MGKLHDPVMDQFTQAQYKLMLDICMDKINDAINTRDRTRAGIDIELSNVQVFTEALCKIYTVNGNVLTLEAVFGGRYCFCWGETPEKHKAWVDAH